MWQWPKRLFQRLRIRFGATSADLPEPLWQATLLNYPFLASQPTEALARLRQLTRLFLDQKEFHGAQGLKITDEIAVTIAAQACLPILYFGTTEQALSWYDDFVGIVVHPSEVVAKRQSVDEAGVVHNYSEVVSGEAMDAGPVMLSWHDVAATSPEQGYCVVIHEFVHKLDMRDGQADGCPPLPPGFMGARSARGARQAWEATLRSAFDDFSEQVIRAERFGAPPPWLDPYGAESMGEFFAVTSEAYFMNRPRFERDFAPLAPLFKAFYRTPP